MFLIIRKIYLLLYRTHVIYNPTSLYCFAYYDDDYILDAYGILDWVNSIPVKSVSMTTLYQRYRIFGL